MTKRLPLLTRTCARFLATNRAAEIDATYAAYDQHPLSEPDEWGNLETWRRTAAGA